VTDHPHPLEPDRAGHHRLTLRGPVAPSHDDLGGARGLTTGLLDLYTARAAWESLAALESLFVDQPHHQSDEILLATLPADPGSAAERVSCGR